MFRQMFRGHSIIFKRNKSNVGLVKKTKTETEKNIELKNAFKLYQLKTGPDTMVKLTKEEAIDLYTKMQLIRRLELACSKLYNEKVIRGFCHLSTGQEACAVGMKAAMRPQDNIISSYRIHGIAYLMGNSPCGILAELAGRKGGCAKGKGGSMHMYAPHFYGGSGIVGAQVPVGSGIAFACKYKGDGGVCLTLYGDGAANQGQVFEAYNMACLWKLPCIFICENNGYGMGTSTARSSCNPNYYTRGNNLPGLWVDGMNVLAVKSATEFAIDYVTNKGPIVMEFATYRYSGHSLSDADTIYRSREEVQVVKSTKDPIVTFKKIILAHEIVRADELKAIDLKIKKEVDEAEELAKKDEEAPLEELSSDVYFNNLEPKIRGVADYSLDHTNHKKSVKKKN